MRDWRQTLALTTAMTMVAGFVDAVGYSALGHLYVAFMSGNSTRLGMAIVAGDRWIMVQAAVIIATFVLGAFAGSLLVSLGRAFAVPAVLGCEILCLFGAYGFVTSDSGRFALLPVAAAMGMQNAIHQVVSGADTGKSFITGTLFGVGASLAQLVTGKGSYAQALVHCVTWTAFAGGVVLGALVLSHVGLAHALIVATCVLAVMTIAALAWRRRPSG